MNVRFQCGIFDQLLKDDKVLPVAPLWTHFQHTLFPNQYERWIQYDKEMISIYDCCLRLNAECKECSYTQSESSGADEEVDLFIKQGKPVFYSIKELYAWVCFGDKSDEH